MKSNNEFVEEYGEDVFDRIFEVVYGYAKYDDIEMLETYNHDALNCYGSVLYRTNDREITCNFESGNWNGAVITSYGENAKPVREVHTIAKFVLDEYRILTEGLNSSFLILLIMKFKNMESIIEEKERNYNYDMRFSPTYTTKNHYRELLHKRYLTVKRVEV